jgi:hypothetical protein
MAHLGLLALSLLHGVGMKSQQKKEPVLAVIFFISLTSLTTA